MKFPALSAGQPKRSVRYSVRKGKTKMPIPFTTVARKRA
jgi:hypothetical protein